MQLVNDARPDATPPQPGNWSRFEIGFGALPSTVEHLLARYGGLGAFAAIELESELATARSIRADLSASDGVRGHRHLGDAVNWVAFGCLGDGIDLAGGTYDLIHSTVAGNGGTGVRKSSGHAGAMLGSISFANDGGPLTGLPRPRAPDEPVSGALVPVTR